MCGIVAAVGERNCLPILIEGLHRLEYRGYDSSGVALIHDNKILLSKELGKVSALENILKTNPISGSIGIAHTRWATHGKPSVANAHPHLSNEDIAIVHNGVIENYQELKNNLLKSGVFFKSETDTEVIVHLLQQDWDKSKNPLENIKTTISKLKGAYGLVVIHKDCPESLFCVRSGSPIVIGYGIEENFISSDSLSLLPVTHEFSYLDEGDFAELTKNSVKVFDKEGNEKQIAREIQNIQLDVASKQGYSHYMEKEIFQQPEVTKKTASNVIIDNKLNFDLFGLGSESIFSKIKNIQIVACGTSFHAGLTAKFWIEKYANIPCNVEVASEFQYRHKVILADTLLITISQSGETADTMSVLKHAKKDGFFSTLGICNVPTSSLVRLSDLVFITQAGVEMSVASTKAFTTQLVALLMLAGLIAKSKNNLSVSDEDDIINSLKSLPNDINNALKLKDDIKKISLDFLHKTNSLFLGRGIQYPVVMEGALKLKEISYIHAESYPSGELKHGPLALIDENIPVIAIAENDDVLLKKLKVNLQEIKARNGLLYIFTENDAREYLEMGNQATIISIPNKVNKLTSPIIYTVLLQLLSYFVAVEKGTDVDKPRNLAKSVTVE